MSATFEKDFKWIGARSSDFSVFENGHFSQNWRLLFYRLALKIIKKSTLPRVYLFLMPLMSQKCKTKSLTYFHTKFKKKVFWVHIFCLILELVCTVGGTGKVGENRRVAGNSDVHTSPHHQEAPHKLPTNSPTKYVKRIFMWTAPASCKSRITHR